MFTVMNVVTSIKNILFCYLQYLTPFRPAMRNFLRQEVLGFLFTDKLIFKRSF